MAREAGIGVSLSSKYYLRNFYRNSKDAGSVSKRSSLSNSQLSQADANALRRAVKQLKNFDYESDATDNMRNSVTAFIETYNNALDAATDSSNTTLNRYAKQLKSLSKESASDLKALGITVKSDGSLEVNSNLLRKASSDKYKKLFSNDANFSHKLQHIAKRLESHSEEAYLSELLERSNLAAQKTVAQKTAARTTGLGLNVDVSL